MLEIFIRTIKNGFGNDSHTMAPINGSEKNSDTINRYNNKINRTIGVASVTVNQTNAHELFIYREQPYQSSS